LTKDATESRTEKSHAKAQREDKQSKIAAKNAQNAKKRELRPRLLKADKHRERSQSGGGMRKTPGAFVGFDPEGMTQPGVLTQWR